MTLRDLLTVVVLMVGVSAPSALANESSSYPVAECKAEAEYLREIAGFESAVAHPEDFSCFVDLESAEKFDPLIVDIRAADEFAEVRVPDSINLSRNELLHSQALKTRSILVVDQGFRRTTMAQLCSQAKQSGFTQVRILRNGVSGWVAAGRAVIGLPEPVDRINRVDPKTLLEESARNRVAVIAGQSVAPTLNAILPPNAESHLLSAEEPIATQIDRVLVQRTNHDFPYIVIPATSDPATDLPHYRSLYVLDGTAMDIRQQLFRQQAIAQQRQAIPERFRCGS